MSDITYYIKKDFEYICYKESLKSYPMHTHTDHVVLGYIEKGMIGVVLDGERHIYQSGQSFYIMPDIPHALEVIDNHSYAMLTVCYPVEKKTDIQINKIYSLDYLKYKILSEPEHEFPIKDMAQLIGESPFYLIRQFKALYGLNPHQFQIQCRVRKAQKLLQERKSVIQVAYDSGFYDQSHLDRCFRKVVRLSPIEYKKSVTVYT